MKRFVSRNWLMMLGAATLLSGAYAAHAPLAQTQTISRGNGVRLAENRSTSPSGLIPNSPQLTIIQGQVIKQQGKIATILTPANTTCGSSQVCPAFMELGAMFDVDTSGAVFQAANGKPTPERLRVGQFVIAAGTVGTSRPRRECAYPSSLL